MAELIELSQFLFVEMVTAQSFSSHSQLQGISKHNTNTQQNLQDQVRVGKMGQKGLKETFGVRVCQLMGTKQWEKKLKHG